MKFPGVAAYKKFFFSRAWLVLLCVVFFGPLFYWQLSSDSLQLEAAFSACLLHLFLLPLLFRRSSQQYSCSSELLLTHNFFYSLNCWFVLCSILLAQFLDPLLRTLAYYWSGLEVYTTALIGARLGSGIMVMLLLTLFLLNLAQPLSPVTHFIPATRFWRRGLALFERHYWYSRPTSVYRRCMEALSPLALVAPALALVNFLWGLGLPSFFIAYLMVFWVAYWISVAIGASCYYRALARLEEGNLRYWRKQQAKAVPLNLKVKADGHAGSH